MLRALSRVVLWPKKARIMKYGTKIQLCLQNLPETHCRSLFSFIPQNNAVKENTLSQKVLEYMRDNPEYSASLISLSDQFNLSSAVNTFGRHQLLLVVAHSSESKSNDIFELFTQYVSHKQNLIQDIINKKDLMSIIKERVFQVIPLMTQSELKNFAQILKKLNFEMSRYLIDIAARIDKECCDRVAELDLEHCLELFDIILLLHGNNIYRKKQFDIFMSMFELHTAAATPHQIVQILHYIGIAKKYRLNKEYVQFLIKKLEEVFEHLSFIDTGIAMSGMFKCNVKLDKSSTLIRKISKWLQMKAEQSEKLTDLESYAFVAMVKVIRAAKHHDEALLSSMNTFIMKSTADTLQPEVIAHTLALYANSRVYDSEIFTKLEYIILKHLTGPMQNIRIKDISRIIWSFSHVGHKGSHSFLNNIENTLVRFVKMGRLESYQEHLSSSLFSLAVLGHYPREAIKEAFQPQKIEKLKGQRNSCFICNTRLMVFLNDMFCCKNKTSFWFMYYLQFGITLFMEMDLSNEVSHTLITSVPF